MAKLRVRVMAEVEYSMTLNKSAGLLPVLTHVWNHYFDNVINEFAQSAEGVQFYHYFILQENVERISWGKKKKKEPTDFPARENYCI